MFLSSHWFRTSDEEDMSASAEQPFWNAEAQTMAVVQRRKLQATRLRDSVGLAGGAPFFSRRLAAAGVRPDDIDSVDDLHRIPVITKNDLRRSESECPPLGDYRVRPLASAVRIGMSSGTTGKPTTMLWTKHDLDIECELSARNHYRMGIRPGMVIVGAHPGYLNGGQSLQQASYDYMGCLLVSIGPPESPEAAERSLQAISGLPVDHWQLFPAALQRLQEAARRIGFAGLPSPEAGRAESQYDKISAGQECVAYLGSACGQSPGAHLAEDLAIVEVLDVHTGEPVEEGKRGQLVVTSLNRDNPMLRYNVEDIVRIDSSPCPCGETTRRGFFEGRTKDIVRVGGHAILPVDVAKALPAGVEFVMQRHAAPTDRLHVRIEGSPSGETRERISATVGVPVDVDWVAAGTLPRAAYKAQRVIDVTEC
jgi:phenylacetate-CoA ligase